MYLDNHKRDFGIAISFKFAKGEDDPCDLLTRGFTFAECQKKYSSWFHGPSWLASSLDNWPKSKLGYLPEDNELQLQPSEISTSVNAAVVDQASKVIDVSHISDFDRLLRVTSLVFKAVHRFKGIQEEDPFQTGKLYLFKEMQKEAFSHSLSYLHDPSSVESVPVLVNNLDLFLDEKDIIRSKGQIGKGQMFDFEVINPILLDKNHHLTELVIEFYHRRCKHPGVQTTMNAVRSNGFLIPKMRQCVKNVLSNCIICK